MSNNKRPIVRADSNADLPTWGRPVTCTSDPSSNQLLAALPQEDLARWRDRLEWVDLPLGLVLYESDSPPSHVYFPCTAIASLLYVTQDGKSAELAMVGKEGVVGISVFMGGETTSSQAVVQSAGVGYRLQAQAIKAEFEQSVPVMQLLLRYTQALITQMAQTAVCNRHHSIEQQFCRWLLMRLDRMKNLELAMTQELIAHLLGVRREGVTEAALRLQRDGLIRYSRGRVRILDRPGLEQRSCECYAVVTAECNRLLPTGAAS